MNKIIKLFLTLSLASSLVLVSAQITGGGLNCQTINGQTVCNVGVQGTIGGGNGQVQGNPQGLPYCSQVPPGSAVSCIPGGPGQVGSYPVNGTPAYTQGQYQRQSNSVDLSFFGNLFAGVGGLVRMLPPILLGIAVVVFFFFLIKYLIAGKNDPKERASSLKGLLYSLLAIFIMVALWGIIAFFGDALGINPNVQVNAPVLPR